MRKTIVLLGCTALAACGGGDGAGPTSPGGVAIGTGTNTGSNSSSSDSMPTLAAPGKATTYVGVGGDQVYQYSTYARDGDATTADIQPVMTGGDQQKQIYAGGTSTVRDSSISIAYDPSDATFTLKVTDGNTGAGTNTRFQDPANRTDFGGAKEPQLGTPNIANGTIRYLQSGDGNPLSPVNGSGNGTTYMVDGQPQPVGDPGSSMQRTTFFYQLPGQRNAAGTTTNYVTFAGYMRNSYAWATQTSGGETLLETASVLERGAFAYGNLTSMDSVPTSGSGTYEGGMIATAVFNPTIDDRGGVLPSYFQWIEGTSKVVVDFASKSVGFTASGTVFDPQLDNFTAPRDSVIKQGAAFQATGSATINLVNTGGFTGQMDQATITNPGATTPTLTITPSNGSLAGSALNGAFYGPGGSPDKVEVGGGFRIVGGNPDERIDIVGSFAGARTGK